MYLRWAERHRFATEIVDQLEGEQAGLKSVTVAIDGRRAYGWLRAERGVHRLVRISPYDSQKRRQTTFALVEVLPEVEDDDPDIELDWDEIRVDTFRSPGRRRPARQQDRLGRAADPPADGHRRPRARTSGRRPRTRRPRSRSSRRASSSGASRRRRPSCASSGASTSRPAGATRSGATSCIPYQMVKDHRTGVETSNTGAVLDGDLDAFMQAELERWRPARRPAASRLTTATGTGTRTRDRPTPADRATDLRPARPDELPACAPSGARRINDYIGRLNQPPIPDDLGRRSHPATSTCRRPTRSGSSWRGRMRRPGGERSSASPRPSSAARSGSSRCCSSCRTSRASGSAGPSSSGSCPRPGRRPAPGHRDRQRPADLECALQPATGSCPRLPVLHLIGEVRRPEALPALPAGRHATPFEAIAAGPPDGAGPPRADRDRRGHRPASSSGSSTRRTTATCGQGPARLPVPGRDGAVLGYGYGLGGRPRRTDRRRGRAARAGAGPRPGAVRPRGAYAAWVPGGARDAVTDAPAAGLRIEAFPILFCWDRPWRGSRTLRLPHLARTAVSARSVAWRGRSVTPSGGGGRSGPSGGGGLGRPVVASGVVAPGIVPAGLGVDDRATAVPSHLAARALEHHLHPPVAPIRGRSAPPRRPRPASPSSRPRSGPRRDRPIVELRTT